MKVRSPMRGATLAAVGAAFGACTLGGCGCGPSSDLLFATATKVGADVVAVNGTPVSAVIGYKRFEGASIPVSPDVEDAAGSTASETPKVQRSVYAGIDLQQNPWLGLKTKQVFATGDAAVAAVGDDASGMGPMSILRLEEGGSKNE